MKIMEKITGECKKAVQNAIEELYKINKTNAIPRVETNIGQNRKADASCSIAFQLSRELKKSPVEIAEEIAKNIKSSETIEKVSALAGFVNFAFSQKYYQIALSENQNEYIKENEKETGKKTKKQNIKESEEEKKRTKQKVIIEYSCPNVGKPLHIGHIRGTIFGHALKKIREQDSDHVVSFNYLGDSGSQVAKLLLALEIYKNLPVIKTEKDLLAYYVKINAEIEQSEELQKRQREILEAIENGDKKIQASLDKVRKLSITAFDNSYDLLGVKFDEVIGESAFIQDGRKVVQEAIEKKIAFKDKGGEIVAKLEPELPNTILTRSNGTTLYLTRDLALADYKFSKYKPSESVNITGSEQNTHFRQVYAILQKLGRNYNNRHIGFGLLTFEGKKLATREGKVILLADIIEEAKQEAKEQIMQREPSLKGKELEERSLAIGLAALKFAVLKVSQEKNIVFNFKQMTSFEGDTGAYLQYSLVRCKSILHKASEENTQEQKNAGKSKKQEQYTFNSEEKELLLLLSAFPVVVHNASKSLAPHILCDYLLKTAAAFSKFYSLHSVLNAEDERTKTQRLEIVKATANVLENGLDLLGITTLEKM